MSQPNIIRWDQAYNRNGDAKLPRAAVNVIRTYMDNHTLAGYVTQETIAEATGLNIKTVRTQINANVDSGWIEVTQLGRAGRASEYRLLFPQPGVHARLGGEVTGRTRPVEDQEPNRAYTPGYSPQPGVHARLQPGVHARPTSPRTSPQEKFSIETDPFGGDRVGDETSNRNTTSPNPTGRTHPVTSEPHSPPPDAPPAPEADWRYKTGESRDGTRWHAWMPPKGRGADPVWF